MEKTAFLEKHIFNGLQNLNEETDAEGTHYFSEEDFEKVLERAAHFGIGIYKIEPKHEGKAYEFKEHETYRKKATDPRWFKNAFIEFKKTKLELQYSATYRVSKRLLAK
tara:strand:+ start:446 stop:772 length:327 start_codon:yes stop_codon:yes gene_type:complete